MRSHWRIRKYHTAQILLLPCLRHGPFQARSLSLQGWGLIDLPLRTAFSSAHPLARRDVPLAQARAFQSSSPLVKGVAEAALYCAHRGTLTF